MAASKSKWGEEDDDSSSEGSSPPRPALARRHKFDDEEDEGDVVESWDAADDSEAEAEKAKVAAAAKAKAEADAAAEKKSKAQRVAAHQAARKKAQQPATDSDSDSSSGDDDSSSDDTDDGKQAQQTEAAKRERLRQTEKAADLKHAQDLFADLAIAAPARGPDKSAATVVTPDAGQPDVTLDLATLALFKPTTKDGFDQLSRALVPLLAANVKRAHYLMFLQEFTRQIVRELPSEQIKKIASGLTTLSNEKMKEEKAGEKAGRKSKAARTKSSLVANRDVGKADVTAYDDGLEEDDFM
ncbi:MAG: Translation initiation factor 3 subunit J component [Phylliscum demangeonii]|nr:MAG: Translation initiation factor 3 subunit J component [Phylliscum demangeonii]